MQKVFISILIMTHLTHGLSAFCMRRARHVPRVLHPTDRAPA